MAKRREWIKFKIIKSAYLMYPSLGVEGKLIAKSDSALLLVIRPEPNLVLSPLLVRDPDLFSALRCQSLPFQCLNGRDADDVLQKKGLRALCCSWQLHMVA
jgi:hypothetical protein